MTISQIEEKFAQMDMGRMAVRVYRGALADSDSSRKDSFWATVAMMTAMMKVAESSNDEGS